MGCFFFKFWFMLSSNWFMWYHLLDPIIMTPDCYIYQNSPIFQYTKQSHIKIWPLQWHYNGRDGVSNHKPHDCLLDRLFRRRSKKTSKLRITGLCAGNSPVTGELPTQMASNTENVSFWWCHHGHGVIYSITYFLSCPYITQPDNFVWCMLRSPLLLTSFVLFETII